MQHIKRVLESPNFTRSLEDPDGGHVGHLFLVGGFAESAIVQEAIRSEFGHKMNVIIPQVSRERLRDFNQKMSLLVYLLCAFFQFFQGVGVAVLRGAVLYGLDPSIVHVRRAMKTYGIGVIKPFLHGIHPKGKEYHYLFGVKVFFNKCF